MWKAFILPGPKAKQIRISPNIDPHNFSVKLQQAVDFLCEEHKVMVTLRFRGRELAHPEIGFQHLEKFVEDLAPHARKYAPPKMIGQGIFVMLSPLPPAKRARNPRQAGIDQE